MKTVKIRILLRSFLRSFFGPKFFTTGNVTDHFKKFKYLLLNVELPNDLKGQKTFSRPKIKDINETILIPIRVGIYKSNNPLF